MNRLVPYRVKVPEEVLTRIEQMRSTTMYLVRTIGPTSYVIQEQNCDKKYKVLIGSMQTCSCGEPDICIHIMFVMLKVLRVPPTTPIVWQKSLLDSEIEMLLEGGFGQMSTSHMKRRNEKFTAISLGDEEVDRQIVVEGEVCAICQEGMNDYQLLTFCRRGCGNNFHIECMKVFGESRRQSKEHIICPLCRHDWGDEALTVLQNEIKAANKAPNVHRGTSCRKCKTKPLRCERYRCVQCKNVDLCVRCFKSRVHRNHAFVMKQNVSDPWVPALRDTQPLAAISQDVIRDLETRELSTNDYDVLLQLDSGHDSLLQDFLMKVISGTKVSADNASTFGEFGATCSLCAQSLRLKAALHLVSCGHVFHESCLAWSILSQVYSCPFPRCNLALLPGLLYLQQEHKKSKTSQLTQSKLQSLITPDLNSSFTVRGLQQHPNALRSGCNILPLIAGPVSGGTSVIPLERSCTNLPALDFSAPNRLKHKNIVKATQRSTLHTKKKANKHPHGENIFTTPDQNQGRSLVQNDSDRLVVYPGHLAKICAEMEIGDAERFLRQKAGQRGQLQCGNKCLGLFANALISADGKTARHITNVQDFPVIRYNKAKQRFTKRQTQKQCHQKIYVGNMSSV
ncbi:putative E3 ubiquitin-protein ligase Zswim2 [Plasmopara halstedii]